MTAPRASQLNVRLSEVEASELAAAAAECGLEVSAWARLVLVHAAGGGALAARLERAGAAVGRTGGRGPAGLAKPPTGARAAARKRRG